MAFALRSKFQNMAGAQQDESPAKNVFMKFAKQVVAGGL